MTPAAILLPDGVVLLLYLDGSAMQIERDGTVGVVNTVAGSVTLGPFYRIVVDD